MVMMCGCSHRFLQLTLSPPRSFLAALEDYKGIQRRDNSTLPVDLFNVAQEARCTDCNIDHTLNCQTQRLQHPEEAIQPQ